MLQCAGGRRSGRSALLTGECVLYQFYREHLQLEEEARFEIPSGGAQLSVEGQRKCYQWRLVELGLGLCD